MDNETLKMSEQLPSSPTEISLNSQYDDCSDDKLSINNPQYMGTMSSRNQFGASFHQPIAIL